MELLVTHAIGEAAGLQVIVGHFLGSVEGDARRGGAVKLLQHRHKASHVGPFAEA